MTTHLAEHFRKRRLEKGLKLSEVALRMGYQRTNRSLSHGCNRLHKFEISGDINIHLFKKFMAVLEIDQATVNELLQEDLKDWLKWANEPIRPHLVVRLMAAIYSPAELPDEVQSVEEAERYASEFAKQRRLRVCLVLSRRVSVYFDDDGSFQFASEAVPGGEPNQPYTVIGGRRCLMQFTDRGIGLPRKSSDRSSEPDSCRPSSNRPRPILHRPSVNDGKSARPKMLCQSPPHRPEIPVLAGLPWLDPVQETPLELQKCQFFRAAPDVPSAPPNGFFGSQDQCRSPCG